MHILHSSAPAAGGSARSLCRAALCSFMLVVTLVHQAHAQDVTVSGIVTSTEDGAPLPGVSVIIKGTTTGTTTDVSGSYRLQVPNQNAVLIFSFIGYAPQEITVGTQTTVSVNLQSDLTQLSEVVVVGYGTVKKTDLTGSVAAVDPEQIVRRGSLGTVEAVQGQVAGVDISNPSGRPGANFKVQIRGQQSLSGGQPLYVVDGMITENIDFLNPQDIERIDILKDASSTAIYGSRGAYGVVIVTTKRGASVKQKAVISYDGYYGVRDAVRMPDFMDGDKFWNFRQDSYITGFIQAKQAYDSNAGNNATNKDEINRRVAEKDYTDWPSLLIRTGRQMNHWIGISGMGENKLGYTLGMGYQEEEGNIVHDNYKRYNLKANVSQTLNDRWAAGGSVNLSIAEREAGSSNAMVNAFRMSPLLKPYFTDYPDSLIVQPGKDLPYTDFTSSVNPLVDMENASNDTRTYYALANAFVEYTPIRWLSVRTSFSPRFKYEKTGKYFGTNSEGRVATLPDAEINTLESFSYIWDNQVTYNKVIGDHAINAMGLYSLNMFRDETVFASATKLPYNSGFENLATADPTNQRSDSDFKKWTLMSYAVRLNYAWRDKYLFTVSNRWDGASVLAEGHKWASFPSAAVAWKINEESFMSGIRPVDALKLRVSYGLTGNNQNVRPYDTYISVTPLYYDFGGTPLAGYPRTGIVSRSLGWERTQEVDAGVDFSLFSGRVTGTVDYYNKLTKDVILAKSIPFETGGYFDPNDPSKPTGPTVRDNIGKVRNKGVEVALTTVNVSTDALTWTTTFNFARNTNEIVELIGGKVDDIANKWFIGQPINVNYNYVFDGIWQADQVEAAKQYGQTPGQARVKDYGDDNKITPADRRILGTAMPSWTGGFSTTIAYKAFDLSASLYTRQGVQVLSPFHQEFLNFEDRGRAKLDVDWYMQENNVTATRVSNEYPQPKNSGKYWNTENVGFYRDASFVKVKNITLGYTVPTAMLERARISSLRVYANVLNPFVFTDYDGFDPEWADATYANGGISSVTYQFGVNLKF